MILKRVYGGNIDADVLSTTSAEMTPAPQETISTTLALSQTSMSIGNLTETTGNKLTVVHVFMHCASTTHIMYVYLTRKD